VYAGMSLNILPSLSMMSSSSEGHMFGPQHGFPQSHNLHQQFG
jgi:hypothetical protein